VTHPKFGSSSHLWEATHSAIWAMMFEKEMNQTSFQWDRSREYLRRRVL